MANAKVCDRCRRIIESDNNGSQVIITRRHYSILGFIHSSNEDLDLCSDCDSKLKVFLSKADIDVTEAANG